MKSLKILSLLAVALMATVGTAMAVDPPEVDAAEAKRRGDMVVVAGEGPRAAEEDAIRAANAPPPDDNHMWFITLFVKRGDAASERVRVDFQRTPELMAYVAAPEASKAWAHFNVYDVDDATQAHRVKQYALRGTPTIVIQPPRNGMWGDAAVVVDQVEGYQDTYDATGKLVRPASVNLHVRIQKSVRLFATKMAKLGFPVEPTRQPVKAGSERYSVQPLIGGSRQEGASQPSIGVNPPFVTPPAVNPFNPQPVAPVVPTFPPQDETPAPPPPKVDPVVVVPVTPSQPWITPERVLLFILAAAKLFELIAKRTPSLTDDAIAAMLVSVVTLLRGGNPNIPPASPLEKLRNLLKPDGDGSAKPS